MQTSDEIKFGEFLFRHHIASGFDKPVLRIVEFLSIAVLFVWITYAPNLLLLAVSTLIIFLIVGFFVAYLAWAFMVARGPKKKLAYSIGINNEKITLRYGDNDSLVKSGITIKRKDAVNTWFVGRAFYVKRKLLTYQFVIPKHDLEKFKKYVTKHGWDKPVRHVLLKSVLGGTVFIIFVVALFFTVDYWVDRTYPLDPPNKNEVTRTLTATQVFDELNRLRQERDIEPFLRDETLDATALSHCSEMKTKKFFEHENPDTKKDGFEPIFDTYPDAYAVQLLLKTDHTDAYNIQDVVSVWMNSDEDRLYILSTEYKKAGVGVCQYTIDNEYTYNVVLHLIY